MKIRKHLLITIVVILSVIISISLFSVTSSAEEITVSGTCGDNLTWTLDSEGLLTISGSGEMENYPLFIYQPWYNYRSSVKKVVIEEGVTSIGSYVFKGCSALTSITIPNTVKSIGDYAFYDCIELTNITIPDSVTKIGYFAFSFCSKLESITIPFVGLSADATGDAACFGAIFGYNTSTSPLYDYHFEDDGYYYTFLIPSSLKNVTIGNAASSIGDYAFNKCTTLTSIYIPYNVRSIGNSAFFGCSALENIYYGGTTSDKQAITVASGNNYLTDATWHYKICIDGSEHSYTPVVTPPTCTSKGYTTYTCACGHKYIGDYLDKTSHSLGDWYTKIYATCISEGTERRDCSDCYYYETRTIGTTPHDYSVTKTISPNCTEPGRHIYTCFDCDHSYSTVYTSALGHYMGNWTVVSSVTCTEDGNRWRECTRGCGYREEETLTATGHSYYGICDSTCDVCDAERTAPHNYVWVIDRESNCGTRGIKHQECTLCNTIIDENTVIAIKGNHAFDDGGDLVCNVCELEFVWLHFDSNGGSRVSSIRVRLNDLNKLPSPPSKSGYNFAGWSTEKNGYAQYPVGYSYYATEANTTLYAQWNKHCATCSGTGKAPCYKCDGDGMALYEETCHNCNGGKTHCSKCWKWFYKTPQQLYDSGSWGCNYCGYNGVWKTCWSCNGIGIEYVERHCGLCNSGGKIVCSDCNGTGNTPRTHVSVPEAPEVESISGNTVSLQAIENGEYSMDGVNWQESPVFEGLAFDTELVFYQRYGKTDTTYTSEASEALKVTICSHSDTEWILDVNPTCTKSGSKHEECTVCKSILSTETIDKLPHSYNAVVMPPTCTDQGYTTYTCVCKDEYVDNYVDALSHSYGEWYEVTASTCTTGGSAHRDCSRCNHFESKTVDPIGHDIVHHEARAPTCTEGGWNAYDACSRCDYITKVELSETSHSVSDWIVDTEATCENNGSKHKECTVCHIVLEESIIPMLTHSYLSVVTNPTCTEQGFTTYTCSECGNSYVDDYVSALGHNYSTGWTTDIAPTCTMAGSKSHHCSRCSDRADVTEISANGHSYGDWYETQAPTCTATGTDEHECSICHNKESRTVDALGHTEAEAVAENRVEPNCTTDGSYDSVIYCVVCSVELSRETKTVSALGHNYQSIWSSNETSHWQECACGDKSELVQHSWNDGETTKEATIEAEGIKTYTCTICSQTRTESIAKLPQQPDTPNIPETPEPPSASDEENDNKGLSGGVVAGIVIGSTTVATGGGFAVWWFAIQKHTVAELGTACKAGASKIGTVFKNVIEKIKNLFSK